MWFAQSSIFSNFHKRSSIAAPFCVKGLRLSQGNYLDFPDKDITMNYRTTAAMSPARSRTGARSARPPWEATPF